MAHNGRQSGCHAERKDNRGKDEAINAKRGRKIDRFFGVHRISLGSWLLACIGFRVGLVVCSAVKMLKAPGREGLPFGGMDVSALALACDAELDL